MGRPRAGRLSSGADPRLARQGERRRAELQLLGPSPSTEPRGGPRARRHLLHHICGARGYPYGTRARTAAHTGRKGRALGTRYRA